MTQAAFVVHNKLIQEEGFDPESDEYYSEIDRRMRTEFPHKFDKQKTSSGVQVASANSTASRNTQQKRRSVKLSPSQIAIAKKLGVPLEEYAKQNSMLLASKKSFYPEQGFLIWKKI